MDYLTFKEFGEIRDIGSRLVTMYCAQGKIDDALEKDNLWLVPKDATKPLDARILKQKKE